MGATWRPPRARNRLMFEAHEVAEDERILLPAIDPRAQHITGILKSQKGDQLRIGVIDGRPGVARVVNVAAELNDPSCGSVELLCEEWGLPQATPELSLLLALPRPRAMRRLWSILGQMALGSIVVANAERVEKYYWESQALEPHVIRRELVIGLEQMPAAEAALFAGPGRAT